MEGVRTAGISTAEVVRMERIVNSQLIDKLRSHVKKPGKRGGCELSTNQLLIMCRRLCFNSAPGVAVSNTACCRGVKKTKFDEADGFVDPNGYVNSLKNVMSEHAAKLVDPAKENAAQDNAVAKEIQEKFRSAFWVGPWHQNEKHADCNRLQRCFVMPEGDALAPHGVAMEAGVISEGHLALPSFGTAGEQYTLCHPKVTMQEVEPEPEEGNDTKKARKRRLAAEHSLDSKPPPVAKVETIKCAQLGDVQLRDGEEESTRVVKGASVAMLTLRQWKQWNDIHAHPGEPPADEMFRTDMKRLCQEVVRRLENQGMRLAADLQLDRSVVCALTERELELKKGEKNSLVRQLLLSSLSSAELQKLRSGVFRLDDVRLLAHPASSDKPAGGSASSSST